MWTKKLVISFILSTCDNLMLLKHVISYKELQTGLFYAAQKFLVENRFDLFSA